MLLVNADLVPGENGTLCRVFLNDISSGLPSLSLSITVKGRGGGGLTLLQSYYIVSRLKGGRIKWAYEYMHEIMSKVYVTLLHFHVQVVKVAVILCPRRKGSSMDENYIRSKRTIF